MTLDRFKQLIDEKLSQLIPESAYFASLYEGARYALLAPGKRIRPLLTLSVASLLKPTSMEAALLPACAVEMVHTYSLIHDDLPCMDDDDFRRGLPTLHKVYSEGHAVLMGDFLLTHAFAILAKAPFLSATQKVALIETLSDAGGGEGMIGGQIMDIEQSPHVEEMHALKTAALFHASVRFGAIIGEANPKTLLLLDTFGIQFGKLFQIVDDLLDGDHPLGQAQAEQTAQSLYQSILATLSQISGDSQNLMTLTEMLFSARLQPTS